MRDVGILVTSYRCGDMRLRSAGRSGRLPAPIAMTQKSMYFQSMIEDGSFSQGMLFRLFEIYVLPLLRNKPKGQTNLTLLYDIAERAFKYNIKKGDVAKAFAYKDICEKLLTDSKYKEIFTDIVSEILAEVEYDATYRLNEVIKSNQSAPNKVRADLIMYSALVENFVRPFLTPLYFYAHVYHHRQKGGAQTAEGYVNTGVSKKVELISSTDVKMFASDFPQFVTDLDLRIRHGGTSHEHWSVLDDNVVEIKNYAPSTGALRDQFTLTQRELEEKVDALERLVWVLRTGFYTFLADNKLGLKQKKPRTKEGVESFSKTFAEGRIITLETPFKWEKDKSQVSIKLSHATPQLHHGGEIFLGTGVAYDIIQKITKQAYRPHMLAVIKNVATFSNPDEYSRIGVEAHLDGQKIFEGVYLAKDFLVPTDPENLPKPIEGQEMDEKIELTWVGEITTPRGTKEFMINELKKTYPDSNFI